MSDDTLKRRSSDETHASVSVKNGESRSVRASSATLRQRAKTRRRHLKERQAGKRHTTTRVAFFHFSYYNPAFKFFVEHVLDAEYVDMGEPTRHTLEVGSQQSNDFVCAPFKHIMGAYIEALDAGADVLVQFTGPCRLGYYGELQESILRAMGYDFTMLNFATLAGKSVRDYIAHCKRLVNPKLSIPAGAANMAATLRMIELLDRYHEAYLQRAGFETVPGSFAQARGRFMDAMNAATLPSDIEDAYRAGIDELDALSIEKPSSPVRVALVGEYFTAQDAPSNLNIEDKLLGMGVELARGITISTRNLHYNEANLRRSISEYVNYDMGPTSTLTIAGAKKYMEQGFDGIIHLKCSGCTPEIDVMPVLQRLSRDYHVPVLFLSYDSQTSDTGLDTRLEAFYDMIAMRKAR